MFRGSPSNCASRSRSGSRTRPCTGCSGRCRASAPFPGPAWSARLIRISGSPAVLPPGPAGTPGRWLPCPGPSPSAGPWVSREGLQMGLGPGLGPGLRMGLGPGLGPGGTGSGTGLGPGLKVGLRMGLRIRPAGGSEIRSAGAVCAPASVPSSVPASVSSSAFSSVSPSPGFGPVSSVVPNASSPACAPAPCPASRIASTRSTAEISFSCSRMRAALSSMISRRAVLVVSLFSSVSISSPCPGWCPLAPLAPLAVLANVVSISPSSYFIGPAARFPLTRRCSPPRSSLALPTPPIPSGRGPAGGR